MRKWRALAAAAVVCSLAVWAGAVSTPRASALTPDPLTLACHWFPAGCNDGTSIEQYIENPGSAVNGTVDDFAAEVTQLAEKDEAIPLLERCAQAGFCGSVGVLAAGFVVGWEIGTAARHLWLKWVGADTYTGSCRFSEVVATAGGGPNNQGIPAGDVFAEMQCGSDTTWHGNGPNADGSYSNDVAGKLGQYMAGSGPGTPVGWTRITTPSGPYAWYKKPALTGAGTGGAPSGLTQTWSSGWADPSTGAGTTGPANRYNTGLAGPNPQCLDLATITIVACASANPNDPIIPVLGWPDGWDINNDGTPDSDNANANNLRCQLAPAAFACPTPNANGSAWTDSGGAKIAFPDAYTTEQYADYIARLRALGWYGTATHIQLTDADGDPDYASGGAPCSSIAAGALVSPYAPLTVYENSSAPSGEGGDGGPMCPGRLATSWMSNTCRIFGAPWDETYRPACDSAWAWFFANQTVFSADGTAVLDPLAIREIAAGPEIKDADVIAYLTAIDSDMNNWMKAATPWITDGTNVFEVHFYWNSVTMQLVPQLDFKLKFQSTPTNP
jgi:hypothetical protein